MLGAVEGITEYLPVSSTGHLLVAARMLGLGDVSDGSALGTYVIAVQVGAILAVLGLYRERFRSLAVAAVGGAVEVRSLAIAIIVAFIPAGVVRSEEHTSELQSLMRISYAVFCLKKKKKKLHMRIT